jgi:hypothetical protein
MTEGRLLSSRSLAVRARLSHQVLSSPVSRSKPRSATRSIPLDMRERVVGTVIKRSFSSQFGWRSAQPLSGAAARKTGSVESGKIGGLLAPILSA